MHNGCRQRFAVDFLILVERNSVNLHRGGRNHIRRLALFDEGIQGLNIHLFVADDIRCDILASIGVVEGLNRSIFDAREVADNGLHLFEFDAETANLDLSVTTADELDVAVRQVAHDVTRAVDAGIFGLVGKRIGNIRLGGLLGTVEVAAADLRSADPELAHCT